MPEKPEIYFHVGMGKVASKYLQFVVFPKINGIHYIPTGKYKKSKEIIKKAKYNRYLVSREFDRQMEQEAKWFSADFPQAKTIILLRRHDSWIASQYRRFVKNGFPGCFKDFMDVDNNKGSWDKKELLFYEKIMILEKYFDTPPLVMFYDDFRANPKSFIQSMLDYMGASIDFKKVTFSPKHTSYEIKQLKAMQGFRKRFPFIQKRNSRNKFISVLRNLIVKPVRYGVLFFGKWIPNKWLNKEDLVPREELEKIYERYTEDWEKCHDYAKKKITTA